MTLQQIRHAKLWFAGEARNWDLAGYELGELKAGFEDVAVSIPQVQAESARGSHPLTAKPFFESSSRSRSR
jgi:hypothetical protein